MANCNSWVNLPLNEKIQMVGKTTHLMQNSDVAFMAIQKILEAAEERGYFKEVIINPLIINEGEE